MISRMSVSLSVADIQQQIIIMYLLHHCKKVKPQHPAAKRIFEIQT